jgi:hypothetical protein
LSSRLERLGAADRRILEIASVVGSDFSLGAEFEIDDEEAAFAYAKERVRRAEHR